MTRFLLRDPLTFIIHNCASIASTLCLLLAHVKQMTPPKLCGRTLMCQPSTTLPQMYICMPHVRTYIQASCQEHWAFLLWAQAALVFPVADFFFTLPNACECLDRNWGQKTKSRTPKQKRTVWRPYAVVSHSLMVRQLLPDLPILAYSTKMPLKTMFLAEPRKPEE